jgi:hypothetical protein
MASQIDIRPMDGPPYAEQLVILRGTESIVCEGGTKTGKTVATMAWQMGEFLAGPGPGEYARLCRMTGRHAWFAQVYRVAKISYDRAVTRLRPLIDAGLLAATETPYPVIRGKGRFAGREWHFLSTEKVSNVYGEEWQSIVIEEFTRHRSGAIGAIMTTAGPMRARVVMIGNVKDRLNDGWMQARLAESGKMGKGWRYLKITCWDAVRAGVVDRETIDAERDRLMALGKRAEFARDYECHLDESDNPFPSALIAAATRVHRSPDPARVVLHLDAGGKENPGGIVAVQHFADGHRHVIAAHHYIGDLTGFEAIVEQWADRYSPAAVTFDSYGGKLCEDLARRFGPRAVQCTARAEALQASYERLRGDFNEGRLTIEPGACDALVRDLLQMQLDVSTPVATTYQWHYAEDDRMHAVHCDAAVALLQGYLPALAKLTSPDGSGHVAVHGGSAARSPEPRKNTTARAF